MHTVVRHAVAAVLIAARTPAGVHSSAEQQARTLPSLPISAVDSEWVGRPSSPGVIPTSKNCVSLASSPAGAAPFSASEPLAAAEDAPAAPLLDCLHQARSMGSRIKPAAARNANRIGNALLCPS